MLRPRLIPCLLVRNKGLVKTVRFGESKYVGDPINAVKIFNEKAVDELVVIDIDATAKGTEPNYELIANLASECRMPLCYGGGIKSVQQARQIVSLGVEKVALSSAAIERPQLVAEIAEQVGNQSVVTVLDIKKKRLWSRYEVFTHNGKRATGQDPVSLARTLEAQGAGEIVINAIDRDGVMEGYDLELARKIREATSVPLTVLGGAGSLADVRALIDAFGVIGASAGSLFVFKGIYRAVLINYPSAEERRDLLR
ncbi:MAG: imidazole glycerol phosphate synthase subunit HisF [Rickettsiales bacterium]|nr:imidazole glycerol phosphate synthase subunit HisF [Rickettsiales bacterium]|tara:strand:- start:606 stop:1370 length:765 start_codon:yes stop_codon:yes gene_type:complete